MTLDVPALTRRRPPRSIEAALHVAVPAAHAAAESYDRGYPVEAVLPHVARALACLGAARRRLKRKTTDAADRHVLGGAL